MAGKARRFASSVWQQDGRAKRVLFARLMAQDAKLILLDEPFSAVDWRTSDQLLRLIASWHQEGRTVAAVLHDLDQVRAYFPDSLLLSRECVAWGPTQEVLVPHNLRRARQMLESWSTEAEDDRRVAALSGAPHLDLLPASGEKEGPV